MFATMRSAIPGDRTSIGLPEFLRTARLGGSFALSGGGAAASGPGPSPDRDKVAGGTGPLAPPRVGGRLAQGEEATPRHRLPGRASGYRRRVAGAILKAGGVPFRCDSSLPFPVRAASRGGSPAVPARPSDRVCRSLGTGVLGTIGNVRVYVKAWEWYTAVVCAGFWLARASLRLHPSFRRGAQRSTSKARSRRRPKRWTGKASTIRQAAARAIWVRRGASCRGACRGT